MKGVHAPAGITVIAQITFALTDNVNLRLPQQFKNFKNFFHYHTILISYDLI